MAKSAKKAEKGIKEKKAISEEEKKARLKATRLKAEHERLRKVIADIDDDKKKAAITLIKNAAWLAASLQELRDIIDTEGYVEWYQNGANQSGMKDSSYVKAYNNMIKNYNSLVKQIFEIAGKSNSISTGDKLAEFLAGKT